jgi:hypothetical protein
MKALYSGSPDGNLFRTISGPLVSRFNEGVYFDRNDSDLLGELSKRESMTRFNKLKRAVRSDHVLSMLGKSMTNELRTLFSLDRMASLPSNTRHLSRQSMI